ncbi:hypothetical protein [Leuconostoc citreum]|uniref:hypothetical protein n=1 Tax=Leuconostoc citreum TaxID=33964 RepID=UPI000BFED3E3|nr:hypothetical protein [Leuconostoc citreum]
MDRPTLTNEELELQLGIALIKIQKLEQQVQDLQDKATEQEDKDLVTLYANGNPYQVNMRTGQVDRGVPTKPHKD